MNPPSPSGFHEKTMMFERKKFWQQKVVEQPM